MTIASASELIDRAVSATGLADFGPDGWREGLERLVATMSEREFGPKAERRMEHRLAGVLASRLKVEHWIATHPEVLDQKVEGPVFILGLPRTATTALQALLCNDPQWRYLRDWEADEPVPPPVAGEEHSDPRVQALTANHDDGGVGQNLHIHEAGGPVDDAALLRLDFHNQELGWPAASYTRWWRDSDMSSAYAYHERVLKLLQSRRPPNRWLVKAPWHNFHIESLARQYPGARFVMCHRDPAQVIPSVASLVTTVHRAFMGEAATDPHAVGSFVLEHLSISIGRVMQFRKLHGDDRFINVRHGQFNADPFGTVEHIYDWLGTGLSEEARATMSAWHERNRKGAHGEHRYSPEDFGLTVEAIRERFATYITDFDFGGSTATPGNSHQ